MKEFKDEYINKVCNVEYINPFTIFMYVPHRNLVGIYNYNSEGEKVRYFVPLEDIIMHKK